MRLRKKYVGRPERHRSNPAEKAWSTFWNGVNCPYGAGEEGPLGSRVIDHLLNDNPGIDRRFIASKDQERTAAQVLQWLGTPVGSYKLAEFLRSPAAGPIRQQLWGDGPPDTATQLREALEKCEELEHQLALARQVVNQVDQLIAGQRATNRLMANAPASAAMFCDHANEVPTGACPCADGCYCRGCTCR